MKKPKKKKKHKPTKEEEDRAIEVGRFRSYGRRLGDGFKTLNANERD